MKFTLTLENFRCWTDRRTFVFDDGMTLLEGESGKGKSTVFAAISFVLHGSATEKRVASYATKKGAVVSLETATAKITRQSKPRAVELTLNSNTFYSGDEAQSHITALFGTLPVFTGLVYQKQKGSNAFVNAAPAARGKFIADIVDTAVYDFDGRAKTLAQHALEATRKLADTVAVIAATAATPDASYNPRADRQLVPTHRDAAASRDLLTRMGRVTRELVSIGTATRDCAEFQAQLDALDTDKSRLRAVKKRVDAFKAYAAYTAERERHERLVSAHATKLAAAAATAFTSRRERDAASLAMSIRDAQYDKALFRKLDAVATAPVPVVACTLCATLTALCVHTHGQTILSDLKTRDAMTEDETQALAAATRWRAAQVIRETVCDNCGETTAVTVDNDMDPLLDEEALLKRDKDVLTRRCPLDPRQTITTCTHPLSALAPPASSQALLTDAEFAAWKKLSTCKVVYDNLVEKAGSAATDTVLTRAEYTAKADALAALEHLRSVTFTAPSPPAGSPPKDYSPAALEAAIVDLAELTLAQKRRVHLERQLTSATANAAHVQTLLDSIECTDVAEIATATDQIEQELAARARLAEHKRVAALAKREAADRSECKIYDTAKSVLKRAKAQYFKQVVDTLNIKVKAFIDAFFVDTNMDVEITSYKEASGEPGTDLSIVLGGFETSFAALSGGEQDRVSLAVTLAFCTIAKTPFLLLDEVTASLDAATTETVLRAVRSLYDGTVVIIAHQVVRGLYDSVVAI